LVYATGGCKRNKFHETVTLRHKGRGKTKERREEGARGDCGFGSRLSGAQWPGQDT